MGQKTHPKGFRLVTTQKHLSEWYSDKASYPSLIEEDYFIRTKINELFSTSLSISHVEINRIIKTSQQDEYVQIVLHSLFPRAKEVSRKVSNYFTESENKGLSSVVISKKNLKGFTALLLKQTIRQFTRLLEKKTKKTYNITLKFIENPFEDATLIAKYISEQLEKRTPFRRAVKQTIKKVKRTEMKGVKVQVSGRLNGAEIARTEWKRDGQVPLHTLKAKIDYTHQEALTVYGIIGIKVWLFHG